VISKNILLLRRFHEVLFLFIFSVMPLYSDNTIDKQLLADQVQVLLIQSYGAFSNLSPIEKIVIEMGRGAFVDNVRIWRMYYNDISLIPIKLHPQIKKVSNIIHKYGDDQEGFLFDLYLKELTFLGYKNIDYYYQALLTMDLMKDNNISLEDIEYAISSPQFYIKKIELFEREAVLKKDIRLIMNSERLKKHLGIYIFFYDFLNKIRDKIIANDLEYSHKRLMKK